MSNQLRVHGEEKTDYQLVQKVLISLPQKFDSIVAVLEQTKDLSTLSMTEMIGTLKAHEKRLSLREERINEGAFYGEKLGSKKGKKQDKKRHEKTNKWCGVCERNNHNEVDCWRKKNGGVPQKSEKNKRKCYVCDRPGHIARDCKLRRSERENLSFEESEDDNEDECHMLFSAIEEEGGSTICEETWLVDSGCINHMSKDAFNQLKISNRGVQNTVEEGETSVGPRGFKSINDLMQQTNEVEEMAHIHEMCLMMAEEPKALEVAMNDMKWIEAMREELRMIEKNKTWQNVERPKDKNVISVKWIFHLKTNESGEVIKHKARLVARGFAQEDGMDYLETFAPVSRYDAIRTLIAIAAQHKWKFFQMDVKSAFLNGDLEEEIYIEQPPGFIEE